MRVTEAVGGRTSATRTSDRSAAAAAREVNCRELAVATERAGVNMCLDERVVETLRSDKRPVVR